MLSIFCCNVVEIGKTLLKKVILDKIKEFRSMAFPLKDRCRLESCCVCFSIWRRHIPVVNTGCSQVFCEVNSQYFDEVLWVVYFGILYFFVNIIDFGVCRRCYCGFSFEIFLIASLKSFSSSRGNSYIPWLLLIIKIRFTCGDEKILSNIKKSRNIMIKMVDVEIEDFPL